MQTPLHRSPNSDASELDPNAVACEPQEGIVNNPSACNSKMGRLVMRGWVCARKAEAAG
eukprot:CAMPEP_0175306448 /NCGR_PEP_ID=MMETSP0093-20121207/64255_1 /TAXON_ID=311494 /ORGANISM="Alexandrium monilatum, Strain CCMP3105" /LENGTH=58 /DNA_ID=CAMNT_0016602887 /DNA_START=12 /DNA_END=186 /DNA_ORIENTATION=+